MQLIDGKKIAADLKQEMAAEVKQMVAQGCRPPHLAIVLVGHDSGSETYVAGKLRACDECGFKSTLVRHEVDVTREQLLATLHTLNSDPDIDGYIVQLPLPAHINEQEIIEAIDYRKDVDGFHPTNVGRMMLGLPCFMTTMPQGILLLMQRYNIDTQGKNCVVMGRGNNAGKPIATLLSQKAYPGNCTVTICHSATRNLEQITRGADILIAAIGEPGYVKAAMVKEGAVVIDVGTTPVPCKELARGWRLRGDVDFDDVSEHCSFITPVPGGVGPMTIVSLLRNTLLAARHQVY